MILFTLLVALLLSPGNCRADDMEKMKAVLRVYHDYHRFNDYLGEDIRIEDVSSEVTSTAGGPQTTSVALAGATIARAPRAIDRAYGGATLMSTVGAQTVFNLHLYQTMDGGAELTKFDSNKVFERSEAYADLVKNFDGYHVEKIMREITNDWKLNKLSQTRPELEGDFSKRHRELNRILLNHVPPSVRDRREREIAWILYCEICASERGPAVQNKLREIVEEYIRIAESTRGNLDERGLKLKREAWELIGEPSSERKKEAAGIYWSGEAPRNASRLVWSKLVPDKVPIAPISNSALGAPAKSH